MRNLGYFNKEINISIRDKNYPRVDMIWGELMEYIIDLNAKVWEASAIGDDSIVLKYKAEYTKCWELNNKCFNFFLEEVVSGRY